mmetsp:Transcript_86128/g.172029  ORF Transcript_86128/g.172029 Transcript_86128/m.172029 type:complete len:215 (+) Transcript_86128:49-693(+)
MIPAYSAESEMQRRRGARTAICMQRALEESLGAPGRCCPAHRVRGQRKELRAQRERSIQPQSAGHPQKGWASQMHRSPMHMQSGLRNGKALSGVQPWFVLSLPEMRLSSLLALCWMRIVFAPLRIFLHTVQICRCSCPGARLSALCAPPSALRSFVFRNLALLLSSALASRSSSATSSSSSSSSSSFSRNSLSFFSSLAALPPAPPVDCPDVSR